MEARIGSTGCGFLIVKNDGRVFKAGQVKTGKGFISRCRVYGLYNENSFSEFPCASRKRALHKSRIFKKRTLNLSYTSSRAAKRRGRDTTPKLSCPARVDPESLDCFVAVGFSQRRVMQRSPQEWAVVAPDRVCLWPGGMILRGSVEVFYL
jgi:hypothetical protein